MVHSAQEVVMIAQEKARKPRSKPSRSYAPPVQEAVVTKPSYEAPPPAYETTQAAAILVPPPPAYKDPPAYQEPPGYREAAVDAIEQDTRHPIDPLPRYGSKAPDPNATYERPSYDPKPAYGVPPPYDAPRGYGSSNDLPPGQPGLGGPRPQYVPPLPPVPPPSDIPRGGARPYPQLVSDVSGFTTVSRQNTAGFGAAAQDGMLGVIATNAIQNVLGWQLRGTPDPNGFLNALKQSFSLKVFEGHVQSIWTPHTHVAQNDVAGGGLAGAQASIYAMANTILAQALPLLKNLKPLKPDFDDEYVMVLKQTAESQLKALVAELGHISGPRLMRVNQCFHVLTGIPIDANGVVTDPQQTRFWTNPDTVLGTLGNLRDEMGLGAVTSSFVNSLVDEVNVTNFRCVLDYINAILNSWLNNLQFFTTMNSPFLGTQLVWISMQLGVVNEAVEELRFVLDSVFIGDAERKTLLMQGLKDDNGNDLPAITLAGLLTMIQSLVTQDGPDIIQTGGKFGIGEYFSLMVEQLREYVTAAIAFARIQSFSALNTNRVLVALSKLERQLIELETTANAVGIQSLPPPSV
jgi:hypothetical protein